MHLLHLRYCCLQVNILSITCSTRSSNREFLKGKNSQIFELKLARFDFQKLSSLSKTVPQMCVKVVLKYQIILKSDSWIVAKFQTYAFFFYNVIHMHMTKVCRPLLDFTKAWTAHIHFLRHTCGYWKYFMILSPASFSF